MSAPLRGKALKERPSPAARAKNRQSQHGQLPRRDVRNLLRQQHGRRRSILLPSRKLRRQRRKKRRFLRSRQAMPELFPSGRRLPFQLDCEASPFRRRTMRRRSQSPPKRWFTIRLCRLRWNRNRPRRPPSLRLLPLPLAPLQVQRRPRPHLELKPKHRRLPPRPAPPRLPLRPLRFLRLLLRGPF